MPISLSPVQDAFYLNVAYEKANIIYSDLYAYAPSTTQFLSRISLLSLLGYVTLLFLVLFTHGTIPETIKTQGKALVIHPTHVFFTCAAVLAALCTLAPIEHDYGNGALAPLFYALKGFSVPLFDFEIMLSIAVVITLFHMGTFFLYATLPASSTAGYVLDLWGGVSQYRLPGFATLVLSVGACWGFVSYGYISPGFLWLRRWEVAATSCLLGFFLSSVFFLRGVLLRRSEGIIDERERCPSTDMRGKLSTSSGLPKPSTGECVEFRSRGPLDHFYCGLSEFNPVLGGADVKMWLYATGAVLLQLNILSALSVDAQLRSTGVPSLAALVTGGCLSFFVAEYMWQERVHLWTYDIFRERLGFKLIWGCLCWYPNFYLVPLGAVVGARKELSPSMALLCVLLFFTGWALTRGANLQKFYCKTSGTAATPAPFLGFIPMETVQGSGGRLLCSGFWGLSRHVNYLGEIAQAAALCLVSTLVGGSPLAWAYPIYYIAIFVPRQLDDDAMCEKKYGKAVWAEYCRRVPYKIIPWVY